MKKITLIIFTFSGNYAGFAQITAESSDSLLVEQNQSGIVLPTVYDSLVTLVKPAVRLYPNPAKNKIEIEISGFEPGDVQVQLIDQNGSLVRNEKRLVYRGNEIIMFMFSVKPGLYFILLIQGKNQLRKSLIIQ